MLKARLGHFDLEVRDLLANCENGFRPVAQPARATLGRQQALQFRDEGALEPSRPSGAGSRPSSTALVVLTRENVRMQGRMSW